MSTLSETLAELSRSLREPPDEIMLEVGAGGEVLLARLRLLIATLLLLMPAINYFGGGDVYQSLVVLSGIGLVLLLSQVWLTLALQHRRYTWLPFISATFDVSLVSFIIMLLAFRSPAVGLNSVVIWFFYPLAIMLTSLRNDVRVTLVCGTLAMLEFLGLSFFFMGTASEPLFSADNGTVLLIRQLQKALLLIAWTIITAVIVLRMQRLVRLSGTDGLTGLPNRTYLNHRVPQLLANARAGGHTICLALLDLDYFRRINAEFGHLVGDRALRHAVNTLRMELGRNEPMMRVGGEEFVIILRQPLGAAWERVDFLRRHLEARPFVPQEGMSARVLTFSAGLAACPQDSIDVSGLMRSADLRLCWAKQIGRNRVAARDGH